MAEWIDAKTRQPKDAGRYLVCVRRAAPVDLGGNSCRIAILRWTAEGWRMPVHFPAWINAEITETVTHWQPLPMMPQAGRDYTELGVVGHDEAGEEAEGKGTGVPLQAALCPDAGATQEAREEKPKGWWMLRKKVAADRQFIDTYYGSDDAFRAAMHDDFCKAQFNWSCFIDGLCKAGKITQEQYNTWAFPGNKYRKKGKRVKR